MRRTLEAIREIADKTVSDEELGVMVRDYLKDGHPNSFIKCFHCGTYIPDFYSRCRHCKKSLDDE